VQSRSGHQGALSGADVHIPATSIKGMLRAAFEAATLSRFGVIDRHDIPLTYRAQAPQALGLVPVRVTGSPGAWCVTPMLGNRTDLADSGPLAAAMLPDEQVRHLIFAPNGLDRLRGIAHGSQERVTLCLVKRHGTAYWVVTHVNGDLCLDPADDIVVWDDGGGRIEIDVDGWVCRTNPGVLHYPPRPVVQRKHDERLFFDVHPQRALAVSPEVEARYCSVLESIRERAQGPQAAAIPTRLTAMLVQGLTGPELQDGDLLYAVFEGGRIRELVPSMIGRRTFDLAPRVLAEGAGLLPATSRSEASVADRVFGMVADPVAMVPEEEVTGDRSADRLAHRGQVVISAVEPVEVNLSETAKVLREQGAPKPSAARFYVRADSEGAALMRDRQVVKSRMYVKGQSLGRKVYPHHRDLDLDSDGFPAGAIDSGGANNRNVTVTSWVKAGSTFTFTIDFHNLTFFEIGALVWLLSPQQLAPPGTQACGYHRLGRGRGLGLGSVRLEATSLQLESTASISKNYRELKGCLGWGMMERDLGGIHLSGVEQVRMLATVEWLVACRASAGDPVLRAGRVSSSWAWDWRPGRDSAPERGRRRVRVRGKRPSPCCEIAVD